MASLNSAGSADLASAGFVARPETSEVMFAPRAYFDFKCRDAEGNLKWEDGFNNLVTTTGKNFILDTMLSGSAYTAAWYLILKGAGTIAAADTAASHLGWSEQVPYAASTRPAITFPASSAGSTTSNSVSITINAGATVAGAGIINNSTKNGTTGTLYNMGDFSASRTVASGDQLQVTITLTIS